MDQIPAELVDLLLGVVSWQLVQLATVIEGLCRRVVEPT